MTYRWRVRRVNDDEFDTRIIGDNGELIDSINRFARETTIPLADPNHERKDDYSDYEPIELEYYDRVADEWVRRFGGYVVNPEEDDITLTIESLSHDAWLRDRRVSRGYVDEPISDILEDLITDNDITPLDWVADNVSVPNDEEIDAEWEGEMLDVILDELATEATSGEPAEWGSTADAEFYFRRRGQESAPSGALSPAIDVEDKNDHRTEKTRSTVFYGEDDDQGAVRREDKEREGEIADRLPVAADRAVAPMSKHHPQLDESAADRKARDLQSKHSEIDAWEFQTTGAGELRPGMVGTLSVPHRDIDRKVRVAQIEYDLNGGLTTILAAENNRAALDRLVQIADEVSRLDARGQDSAADAKITIGEDSEITIESFGEITKTGKLPPHEYAPPDATAVDIETSAYDGVTSPYLAEVRLEDQATEQPVVIHEWGDV